MNPQQFLDALNDLPDELIEPTERLRSKKRRSYWPVAGVVAACLCLVLLGGREKSTAKPEVGIDNAMGHSVMDQATPEEPVAGQSVSIRVSVTEINGTSFIVVPVPGSPPIGGDRIEITIEDSMLSAPPRIGDVLEIDYDGRILETDPLKLGKIHKIRIVE